MLLSGLTGLSVPGGSWFIDAGVRDAIEAGILEGPRIYCAGRNIGTYGSISDNEPSWVGAPDHSHIVLANTVDEMVVETRRQLKNGVDFVKLVDSVWGDKQTIAPEEMKDILRVGPGQLLDLTTEGGIKRTVQELRGGFLNGKSDL